MAQNGVSNGSSNGNGANNGQTIDEGLYSRQLFVLGKCGLTRLLRTTTIWFKKNKCTAVLGKVMKKLWEASCLFKIFCEAAVHLDMSILCLSSLRARKSILFPYPSATLWATAIGIRPTVGVAMPWYSNLTLSYINEFLFVYLLLFNRTRFISGQKYHVSINSSLYAQRGYQRNSTGYGMKVKLTNSQKSTPKITHFFVLMR